MMLIGRAGRFVGVSLVAGILLAGCGKTEDRAKVAADLQKSVEDYLVLVEGPKETRILSHSDVKVTAQQDAGYLVAINGLKAGAQTSGAADIGTVSYVLTPKDEKTFEASQLKIPGDVSVKLPNGQVAGDIKMTTKVFNGTWLSDAHSFIKFDLQLADIALTDQQGAGVKIASANLNTDSTDKGSGLWDQVGKLLIAGLDGTDGNGGHIQIQQIDGSSSINGLKLLDYMAKLKAMNEALAKQASANAAATTAGNANATAGSAQQTTVHDFVSSLPGLLAAMNSDFHLTGLSYKAADNVSSVEIGKVGVALSATGIDQSKATVKLSIDHDALAVHMPEAQNDLIQSVLPANSAFVLSLTDVPTKDLADLAADISATTMAHPEPSALDAQYAVIYAKAMQLLQQNGVVLKIEPSHVTSTAANVDATGQFSVQQNAIHGAVGTLDVAIKGIDQVIAIAQKQAEQDPAAAQYVAMIQALLTYSAREQGGDGKAVDKFKIDVPATGTLSVNGKPLPF